jgi:hypothetical protein
MAIIAVTGTKQKTPTIMPGLLESLKQHLSIWFHYKVT